MHINIKENENQRNKTVRNYLLSNILYQIKLKIVKKLLL